MKKIIALFALIFCLGSACPAVADSMDGIKKGVRVECTYQTVTGCTIIKVFQDNRMVACVVKNSQGEVIYSWPA